MIRPKPNKKIYKMTAKILFAVVMLVLLNNDGIAE